MTRSWPSVALLVSSRPSALLPSPAGSGVVRRRLVVRALDDVVWTSVSQSSWSSFDVVSHILRFFVPCSNFSSCYVCLLFLFLFCFLNVREICILWVF